MKHITFDNNKIESLLSDVYRKIQEAKKNLVNDEEEKIKKNEIRQETVQRSPIKVN